MESEEAEKPKLLIVRVKDFVISNPQIIYRGVPCAVMLYITGPVAIPILVTGWKWLPFIYSLYKLWGRFPSSGVVGVTSGIFLSTWRYLRRRK